MPLFLVVAALSGSSTLVNVPAHTAVYWFPLWAPFAVWVTLDAPALYRLVGPQQDPFGAKVISLSALGFANIVAMFLFLVLTNTK